MSRFLADANGESLLGRVRSNFDSIDVNPASNAWLNAILMSYVKDLFAGACAENQVIRFDLLGHNNQFKEFGGM